MVWLVFFPFVSLFVMGVGCGVSQGFLFLCPSLFCSFLWWVDLLSLTSSTDGAGFLSGRPADIWSLGCTVIQMFTGRPPWTQYTKPLTAMFHIAAGTTDPPVPEELSPCGQVMSSSSAFGVTIPSSPSRKKYIHPFCCAYILHSCWVLYRTLFGTACAGMHDPDPLQQSSWNMSGYGAGEMDVLKSLKAPLILEPQLDARQRRMNRHRLCPLSATCLLLLPSLWRLPHAQALETPLPQRECLWTEHLWHTTAGRAPLIFPWLLFVSADCVFVGPFLMLESVRAYDLLLLLLPSIQVHKVGQLSKRVVAEENETEEVEREFLAEAEAPERVCLS